MTFEKILIRNENYSCLLWQIFCMHKYGWWKINLWRYFEIRNANKINIKMKVLFLNLLNARNALITLELQTSKVSLIILIFKVTTTTRSIVNSAGLKYSSSMMRFSDEYQIIYVHRCRYFTGIKCCFYWFYKFFGIS